MDWLNALFSQICPALTSINSVTEIKPFENQNTIKKKAIPLFLGIYHKNPQSYPTSSRLFPPLPIYNDAFNLFTECHLNPC